jgi:hypothetical protein
MSPALQKLRKDLDHAKARHALPGAPAQNPVGFDVIDLLFSAIAAQDVELRRLKAQGHTDAGGVDATPHTGSVGSTLDVTTDAYVGHIEAPANSVVYQAKKPKPPHVEPPVADASPSDRSPSNPEL